MTTDLKKLWAIFTPAERRKSIVMLVLIILMAVAETAGVLSLMPFLTVLGKPTVIHTNHYLAAAYHALGFTSSRSFIFALGFGSVALVVGSSAFKTITLHLINRFVHFLRHSISARLLSRYLHQPYEFFLTRNPSILARNVLSEVDQLQGQLIRPVAQLIAQGSIVVAMTVLIFVYDPITAIAIVAVLGVLYGGIYGAVRKRLKHIGQARHTANGARYKACNEALGGIKDLKVTQSAAAYQDAFNHASREFSRHSATNETLAQSPLYLVEATGISLVIVLAMVLLRQSNDIGHVLPALGLYGFAAYRMLPSAQIMYRGFANLKFTSASLTSIHHDLGLADDATIPTATTIVPQQAIRLENIHYAYPSAPDKPVFNGFDLTIPARQSTGIAGKSGAGKSTLMDLLLGLLHPVQGTLSVDGVVIDASNASAWQRAIGYVPQHIYLADASVAQNIAFGIAEDAIDMQAVERAARAAQIHDFVTNELPQSYATPVGDRGIRLSGGQRQRIGIARALYRDPAVLFFDEATSALDNETEAALNDAIARLSGDKTIVVIAHKEASLRSCSHVVQLHAAKHNWPRHTDLLQ
ncbi:MAG TPA: ABC transporter ATP-binding protein [Rhodanobacteraceae bacterium]